MPLRLLLLLTVLILALSGCSSTQPQGGGIPENPILQPSSASPSLEQQPTILTLGDIEADEPAKKVARLLPLAKYLETHLKEVGIEEARVRIARDQKEMASFMQDGSVDVYFDSAFPTTQVQKVANSQIILRRWKGEQPEYWSVIIALNDSSITSPADLQGTVLAVEEPNSTSGFVLPVGTLAQRGYKVREVAGLSAGVDSDEIGYFFTRDEENTVEAVLQGLAPAGAISSEDYEELPYEIKDRLILLNPSFSVPRQLVSVRPGLDPVVVESLIRVLTEMEEDLEGRLILEQFKKTTRFDNVPAESYQALANLTELIDLVVKD